MNDAKVDTGKSLDAAELELMDRYWRAANYVSVGQIYLLDNPLLGEPLKAEHVKPRLLGHERLAGRTDDLVARLDEKLAEHKAYVRKHGEDMPEILHWTWPYKTAAEAGD